VTYSQFWIIKAKADVTDCSVEKWPTKKSTILFNQRKQLMITIGVIAIAHQAQTTHSSSMRAVNALVG